MSNANNKCQLVRETCRRWMAQQASTTATTVINDAHIPKLCNEILDKYKKEPIQWDEEGWHYSGSNFSGSEQQRKERVALYILALDAINFCFWPVRERKENHADDSVNKLEYDTLAVALKRWAEQDDGDGDEHNHSAGDNDHGVESQILSHHEVASRSYAFAPPTLASMTVSKMNEQLVNPYLSDHYLDNIEKRCELWNELGNVLMNRFDGSALNMIDQAHGYAPNLVGIITENFPGFKDCVVLDDDKDDDDNQNTIWFLKRAQIAVGDLNAALQLQLNGMEELTCFADYRVPQILRKAGVLQYSPELAKAVDGNEEIERNSVEEISIRAATVVSVDRIVQELNKRQSQTNHTFTSVEVDWHLWQVGERLNQQGGLDPFHRVRTHFY